MIHVIVILVMVLGLATQVTADYATGHAAFQRQDYAMAEREWGVAARAGDAAAQYSLGILYASGFGVQQSYRQAASWFHQAADQGYGEAQYNLGLLHAWGQGVPRDYVQAFNWLELAARQGVAGATQGRDAVATRMSATQRAQAQALIAQWQPRVMTAPAAPPQPETTTQSKLPQVAPTKRPKTAVAAPPPRVTPTAPPAKLAPQPDPMPKGLKVSSAGTGFRVSVVGHILTNHHVVDECKAVSSKQAGVNHSLRVIGSDPQNDLALLQQTGSSETIAAFRAGKYVRPGDGVVAIGFPLRGILASEAQITTGNVSAMAGVQDDQRFLQMTAPVQPGNSGGPLLDQSGNVVGVVASKLDAGMILDTMGDIPQNVNFAIKASIARKFLDSYDVNYLETHSDADMKNADVGDKGRQFTFVVECWK